MPWKEMSVMSQRREFVELAQAEGTNKRGLCRRFGISPTTGYKWLGRFREGSEAGLVELPRRPHYSPARTPSQVEQAVLSARAAHPAWGARKLRRWLLDRRDVFEADMPAPSTIYHGDLASSWPALTPTRGPSTVPGSDLNTRHPTTCGRWTSKATSLLPEDAATL